MRTPLQVVLLRDKSDRRTMAFEKTLRLAFEGSDAHVNSPSAYLDDAVDLGIRVLEPAYGLSICQVNRLLEGAKHTVVVVVGDVEEQAAIFRKGLAEDCFVYGELASSPADRNIQSQKTSDGIESTLAPIAVALRAIQLARVFLARDLDNSENSADNLTLFISHAKADGIAAARSLIAILKQFRDGSSADPTFRYFYDDDHLKPGKNWKKVLETKAQESIFIALRTSEYENRFWCRREFLCAESIGMPIITVDLRPAQYYNCSLLPFDSTPTIRVHDGNFIRVLLHAIATHLRVLRVRSQIPRDVVVLPHRPSIYSLGKISEQNNAGQTKVVSYPGPPIPALFAKAVKPLLECTKHPIVLKTYDELEGR